MIRGSARHPALLSSSARSRNNHDAYAYTIAVRHEQRVSRAHLCPVSCSLLRTRRWLPVPHVDPKRLSPTFVENDRRGERRDRFIGVIAADRNTRSGRTSETSPSGIPELRPHLPRCSRYVVRVHGY